MDDSPPKLISLRQRLWKFSRPYWCSRDKRSRFPVLNMSMSCNNVWWISPTYTEALETRPDGFLPNFTDAFETMSSGRFLPNHTEVLQTMSVGLPPTRTDALQTRSWEFFPSHYNALETRFGEFSSYTDTIETKLCKFPQSHWCSWDKVCQIIS